MKPLGKKRSYLGRRDWPNKPMELVSIDYLTELPPSTRNNKHLLVLNDQFSKFLQVYPIQDKTAKTAADCLIDYILKFGTPQKIYSDRDPSYESELFQRIMKYFGV